MDVATVLRYNIISGCRVKRREKKNMQKKKKGEKNENEKKEKTFQGARVRSFDVLG